MSNQGKIMKYFLLCAALASNVGVFAENSNESDVLQSELVEIADQPCVVSNAPEEVLFIGAFVIFKEGSPEDSMAARRLLGALLNESCVRSQINPDICSQIARRGFEAAQVTISPLIREARQDGAPHRFSGEDAFVFGSSIDSQNAEQQNPHNPDNGQQ